MTKVSPKDTALALFLGLLVCAGTAVIFAIAFAVANIWLEGHSYSWHHWRFVYGAIDLDLFGFLLLLFSGTAGLLTGIFVIKSRKR